MPAPVERCWDVLARFGDLARWAPNVHHTSRLHGPDPVGVGTVRRVQVGRATLLETVTACEPPHRLAYDIAGLPPVLRSVQNAWELTPANGGTEVVVTTTVDAGARPPREIIARLVARRMSRESAAMLRGLADAAAHAVPGGPHRG